MITDYFSTINWLIVSAVMEVAHPCLSAACYSPTAVLAVTRTVIHKKLGYPNVEKTMKKKRINELNWI